MGAFQDAAAGKPLTSAPTRMRVLWSAVRYLAGKALMIMTAAFLGVFITLMIANVPVTYRGGFVSHPFEDRLMGQVFEVIQTYINNGDIARDEHNFPNPAQMDAVFKRLSAEAGLNLPYVPRHLVWTYKMLTFSWGELDSAYLAQPRVAQGIRVSPEPNVILEALPNTFLLVGTAYLLVFLIGMPSSLYLARHYGSWLDRTMAVLSPISSVPSWVFAALLLTLFAVQLHWLPVSGMFDFRKPTEPIPYAMALLRHMVLPVSALVLSLLFQMVYTWRTFFVIYSEEDYVDLARAKGLDTRLLEKRYILRPALPYIVTSFATSLFAFWQLTVALEKIFQWPGIGLLYLKVLPNFWGESMEVGDLMIVVQIVVIFAYVLGIVAFTLELAYVFMDPRIHLVPASHSAQNSTRLKATRRYGIRLFTWLKGKTHGHAQPKPVPLKKQTFSLKRSLRNLRESLPGERERVRLVVEQLRMYPSAIFGLAVIVILFAGSLYALLALPYEEIGMDYNQDRVRGRNLMPRTAAPAWLNLFSSPPRLSRVILDENSREANVTTEALENGWSQKTVIFEFDYRYKEMPSDVFLYLDSTYDEKIPFISLEWTTPDGRTIDLKAKAMGGETNYDMQTGTFVRRLLIEHPEWRKWYAEDDPYPTPAYRLLFAKPGSTTAVPLRGTYQLKITSLFFEEGGNVQPELVLLGQVYGLAGTDFWRRDLLVPLFWGMPFTLMVGFVGTFITVLIAMLLPAMGVWFGGWLDHAIQRLSEMNMVLPGLAIAVLAYAMLGVHIWVILGVVVVLNALGAPIKSFRSAFLQAKEAPYIEMARSYGASDFRIITRYLIPRILPVLIPYLVMQIPTFVFLEATLGFFNIRSIYPSWGRIIYEGIAQGALYGSPYWVLEPIFLLLLTGLAFAMLGSALERILNPRVMTDIPVAPSRQKQSGRMPRSRRNRKLAAGLIAALLAAAIFIPAVEGKTLAKVFMDYFDPLKKVDTRIRNSNPGITKTASPSPILSGTDVSVTSAGLLSTPLSIPALTSTPQISCPPANSPSSARVLEIIDGNTIKVLLDELVYVVRYIGVDVPQDQRNAFQAYLANSDLVFRKDITLIADTVDKDSSGRLLRYVLVGETFVNQQLLQSGLGIAAALSPDFSCTTAFQAAESSAVQAGRGMWAAPTPVPTP